MRTEHTQNNTWKQQNCADDDLTTAFHAFVLENHYFIWSIVYTDTLVFNYKFHSNMSDNKAHSLITQTHIPIIMNIVFSSTFPVCFMLHFLFLCIRHEQYAMMEA